MKKGAPFYWDQACIKAFESIKSYLINPKLLTSPILRKWLILYITTHEGLVSALLAKENKEEKENSFSYLSRMMMPNEMNYSPIKKLFIMLVFSIQKHYFQDHVVCRGSILSPIKLVMSKPVLNDWLMRWYP